MSAESQNSSNVFICINSFISVLLCPNELSSVPTQNVPRECTHQEHSFEWSHLWVWSHGLDLGISGSGQIFPSQVKQIHFCVNITHVNKTQSIWFDLEEL